MDAYGLVCSAVFAGVIAAIAFGVLDRAVAGALGVAVLLLVGAVGLSEAAGFIDWDVVGLVVLMSFYSVVLEVSGLARWVALSLARRVESPVLLAYSITLAAGVLSLALENAVTVLVFAPVALALARALSISPAPLVIGIALASGMAGSATMIGDPPAIITAGHYDLGFLDFIVYKGRPSMFFITIASMVLALAVYTFSNFRMASALRAGGDDGSRLDRVFAVEALLFLLVKVSLLSLRKELEIPMSLAAAVSLSGIIATRLVLHGDRESVREVIEKGLDLRLPVFLSSVFILSGSLKKHSVTDAVAEAAVGLAGESLVSLGVLVFLVSAALSSLIENIPVTLTLLPVADSLAARVGADPVTLAWGVLAGLTAGGGWTYIGSGANVVAVRILEREGVSVSFAGFTKTALPFNIANTTACLALYAAIWLL
ncbi:MAG: SLC13 family permease [Acidilobaceae archaeon]